ncbi:MAG: DUF1206 domain-containing protein [Chthoniobacterales bacterium]
MPTAPRPWMIFCARAGQLAKGFIYLVMALIAAHLIWSGKGDPAGSREAISAVAQQPFGRVLLLALIGGLICYILARLLDTFMDLEGRGRDVKALALRARSLLIALVYAGLTAAAVKTALGGANAGQSHAAQDWTARVMQTPFGTWSVIIIGLGIIGTGLVLGASGCMGAFKKKLALDKMQPGTRRWMTRICVFGLVDRGIVFVIIGGFLVAAGWSSNPSRARGLSGTLVALRNQPYGQGLFAVVAAGLAAYGIYCGVRAFYGRWGTR